MFDSKILLNVSLICRHRVSEEVDRERAVDVSSLRDPQTDEVRVKEDKWRIVIGICTHLGMFISVLDVQRARSELCQGIFELIVITLLANFIIL